MTAKQFPLCLLGLSLLLLVACDNRAPEPPPPGPDAQARGSLAFGGDVFLARYAHTQIDRHGYDYPFADIKPLFDDSDAVLINLEAVLNARGRAIDDKNERSPYLFRGRPDLVRVLTSAGVDMITGGNNHVGDYGPVGIAEQIHILNAAGIGYVGIGSSRRDAESFRRLRVGDLVVAVIGVDSTTPLFRAGLWRPGTYWLDEENPDQFVDSIGRQVRKARKKADLVIMTVHWGPNGRDRPTQARRELAQRLVREAGVDAILGHSAHVIQGMELVDGKPVLYDTGNLLLDYNGSGWTHKSLLFRLHMSPGGVREIELHPIRLRHTRTSPANAETAEEILARFTRLSRELNPDFALLDNRVVIPDVPLKHSGDHYIRPTGPKEKSLPERDGFQSAARVTQPPPDMIPIDHTFDNGITLIGVRPIPDSARQSYGFFVTSYWTTNRPQKDSALITVRLQLADGGGPAWGNRDTYRNHHPGDWSYPTDLWRVGEIVEDHYFVRGHARSALASHQISLGLQVNNRQIGETTVGEIEILPRNY